MMVDRNEFFREATLRICGNLQIEEALFSTFQFLKEVMPVDMIFLRFVAEDRTAYRTLAIATEEGGKTVDKSVALSADAQGELNQHLDEYLQGHEPNHVWLFR